MAVAMAGEERCACGANSGHAVGVAGCEVDGSKGQCWQGKGWQK